jgi:hypothetical protein
MNASMIGSARTRARMRAARGRRHACFDQRQWIKGSVGKAIDCGAAPALLEELRKQAPRNEGARFKRAQFQRLTSWILVAFNRRRVAVSQTS